jgi:hypothetical protein
MPKIRQKELPQQLQTVENSVIQQSGFQPLPKMLSHFRAAGAARSQIHRTCR